MPEAPDSAHPADPSRREAARRLLASEPMELPDVADLLAVDELRARRAVGG